MIRIIGGRWKRKSLNVLDYSSLRPTPSRVRETVFNWISTRLSLSDASVLDLFSGSGALGIEAASRGAKEVQLVESNIVAVKQIQSLF